MDIQFKEDEKIITFHCDIHGATISIDQLDDTGIDFFHSKVISLTTIETKDLISYLSTFLHRNPNE